MFFPLDYLKALRSSPLELLLQGNHSIHLSMERTALPSSWAPNSQGLYTPLEAERPRNKDSSHRFNQARTGHCDRRRSTSSRVAQPPCRAGPHSVGAPGRISPETRRRALDVPSLVHLALGQLPSMDRSEAQGAKPTAPSPPPNPILVADTRPPLRWPTAWPLSPISTQ